MYTAFYGLREKPFALTPNPRFLYLAESHREALAHLLYGLEQGEGFIVISGEVGTGKTTICRSLLERLGAETEIAFLFNPSRNAGELLQSINEELGLPVDGLGRRELLSRLNRFLLEKKRQSRRVVLIVDEAQNLSTSTLEQVRLLSNLETASSKLIQIILLGQPELDEKLDSDGLRQLRQRISVRWSLEPLPLADTLAYVRHRLRVAAGAEREIFSEPALREIHRHTGGIPRLINVLCDRALLAGYAAQAHRIGPKLVRQAVVEVRDASGRVARREVRRGRRALAWGSVAAGLLAAAFGYGWRAGVGPPRALLGRPPLVSPSHGPLPDVSTAAALVVPQPLEASSLPEPLEPDPEVSLAERLTGLDESEGSSQALDAVLGAYGLADPSRPPHATADVLVELTARGLGVVSLERTTFDVMRRLDYPALLELRAGDGEFRMVALVALEGEIAELVGIGVEGSLRLPVAAVEASWDGTAHVVWRPFEQIPHVLGYGESGAGVLWLQDALAELGYFEGILSGVYGERTLEGVRHFQRQHALREDGIVGPVTQMVLYDVLKDYSPPRLADEESG